MKKANKCMTEESEVKYNTTPLEKIQKKSSPKKSITPQKSLKTYIMMIKSIFLPIPTNMAS